MTKNPGSSAQRIPFGEELRTLRANSALTSEEAAAKVRWHRSGMSKVESGKLLVNTADINALLDLYRAPADTARRVRSLADQARHKRRPVRLPERAEQYTTLEVEAVGLDYYFRDLIPGALQTERYATAHLASSVGTRPADIPDAARSRAMRAARFFHADAPRVRVVLGEEALRRVVGGPAVLLEQLEWLRELADAPSVSLRVVQSETGAHPASGTSFVLIRLPSAKGSVAYVEGLTGSDHLSRDAHIRTYELAFNQLRTIALDEGDTTEMIGRLIEEVKSGQLG